MTRDTRWTPIDSVNAATRAMQPPVFGGRSDVVIQPALVGGVPVNRRARRLLAAVKRAKRAKEK